MRNEKNTKFYKRLMKFGRKNDFCRNIALFVLIVYIFVFRTIDYCMGNGKRFVMLTMTFLAFAVYSSFSFPMFIVTDKEELNNVILNEDASMNVSLAKEQPVDLSNVEILEDSDVLDSSDEAQLSHGMYIADKYDVSEILEASKDRIHTPKEAAEDVSLDVSFSPDDWRLVLINKQHSIPEDYTFTLETIKGDWECDERIIDDLLAMFQGAEEDDVSLQICSPYRDMERQVMLFNRKIERYMNRGMSYMEAYQISSQAVTVPGASEHQIGLALDIVCPAYTTLDEGFGDTQAGIWLAENSYKYGFILRYPKGKEYITGIEYEPWHFRYVGAEAATVITEEGITLEEFWEEYLNHV